SHTPTPHLSPRSLHDALPIFLLNIEVADFYATGPEITFRFGVTLAQDLTYTICWLVFGLGLLTAGIYLHNRYGRIAAIALIALRSEEHTSELQSRVDLVCRLL